MVVDKVDVTWRLIEPKDHPPIACDFHGPETLQVAFGWMQPATGATEILGATGPMGWSGGGVVVGVGVGAGDAGRWEEEGRQRDPSACMICRRRAWLSDACVLGASEE